jgi:hypothetical protein
VLDEPPDGITTISAKHIDVDADGTLDLVATYIMNTPDVPGNWHLRVELADGGAVDVAFDEDPSPGAITVLGSTYVGSNVEPGPGGLRPVLFVTTGAGASSSIVTLFRLDGCTLASMGDESTFVLGAGVMHAEMMFCDGVSGASLLTYRTSEFDPTTMEHTVTETAFTRSGNDLVVYGAGPITYVTDVLPPNDGIISGCGGVDHP